MNALCIVWQHGDGITQTLRACRRAHVIVTFETESHSFQLVAVDSEALTARAERPAARAVSGPGQKLMDGPILAVSRRLAIHFDRPMIFSFSRAWTRFTST